MWMYYRQAFGLIADRIEWAVANGASAQCHAWGAKVKSTDVVPRFGPKPKDSIKKLVFQLAYLPGAQVEFVPKDGGKILTGQEALATLDDYRTAPNRKRTLDDKTPAKRESSRRTLSGD